MKSPRAEAIARFMKFLSKSEALRAMPKQPEPAPQEQEEGPSEEALQALQSLTQTGE